MQEPPDQFAERGRKVLRLAEVEARRLNHNYIGTEHLVLGLLREDDGVAAKVLWNLGVELTTVQSALEANHGARPEESHGRFWSHTRYQERA